MGQGLPAWKRCALRILTNQRRGRNKFAVGLNRTFGWIGVRPPWVWEVERIHEYWRSRTDAIGDNHPGQYLAKYRSGGAAAVHEALREVLLTHVPQRDVTILELGPNCGLNLHYLWTLGYQRLSGIEINPDAIATLRNEFPELKACPVDNARIEDAIVRLPDQSVDIILSCGVLFHLPWESDSVFGEIARVARVGILTLEIEDACNACIFPRNYRRIFAGYGFTEAESLMLDGDVCDDVNAGTMVRWMVRAGRP